jgi:hypothetical protein
MTTIDEAQAAVDAVAPGWTVDHAEDAQVITFCLRSQCVGVKRAKTRDIVGDYADALDPHALLIAHLPGSDDPLVRGHS